MSGSDPEIGWLAGSTQRTLPNDSRSGEGALLWAGESGVATGGDWRPEELRTIEHPLGRAAMVGECFATESELQAAAEEAFAKGNHMALADLPGSYTTIIQDANGSHFVGDPASQHPLYLRASGRGVQFSTHTKSFRSGSDAAPPDPLSLAIEVGMPWVNELRSGRTPLGGVMKTLPQEAIHIDTEGHITTTRHDSMVPSKPLSPEEATERLREAMRESARRRLDIGCRVTADMSGGLDSTSAAYFLAEASNDPLTVVTQHSRDMPLDDLTYVYKYLQLPASKEKFRHLEYEQPASAMMFGNMEGVTPGDVPDSCIRVASNFEDYFAFLRARGSDLHVTGSGADELFDMPPRQYLGQLARLSTLPYFLRAAFQVARTEKDSVKNVIADSVRLSRLNPRDRLQQLAHVLEVPGRYDGNYIGQLFGAGTAPYWLPRAMRKEVAEYAAAIADQAAVPAGMDPANYRIYNELLALGSAQHSVRQLAARHGVRLSPIFHDTAVMKACLGLPAHQRMNPWIFKQLMGRAFAGIVPPEVTSRKTKGDYTGHAFAGLRGAQDFLRNLVDNSRLAELGVIDPVAVRKTIENGFAGANVPLPSLDNFIATEVWLRSLDNESWEGRRKRRASEAIALPAEEVVYEPLDGTSKYGMPDGVIAVTTEHGAVIVDMPKRQYRPINADAAAALWALQQGGSVAGAYDVLAGIYREVPRDNLVRGADACIRSLIQVGVLAPDATGHALFKGNVEQTVVPPSYMVAETEETQYVQPKDYAAAYGALALTRILQKEPSFAKQMERLNAFRSKRAECPATPEEATRLLAAVRRLGRVSLGRVACLELAMATVIASALRGRGVDMVLGVRSDPQSFHAWPQVGDTPIRTEADEPIAGVYQPLIKL